MIDLHVHTNVSDGTFAPADVVKLASEKGLKALAITDHDSVAGVGDASEQGGLCDVEIIPGVEISSYWKTGILHILGYYVDVHDPGLLHSLEALKNGRQERMPKILEKLKEVGITIEGEEIDREAVGGVPGRPHVARVLMQKKYVRSIQDAFDIYLRRGRPAYVEKTKKPPEEAIRVILDAGGVPVLAHPYSLNEPDASRMEAIIRKLKSLGLAGIEAHYPQHSRKQTKLFIRMAERMNLAATGGTDFHGANKPEIELGRFPDGTILPYSLVESLKNRIKNNS